MSNDVRVKIEIELNQLRALLTAHQAVIEASKCVDPGLIEMSALAAMLHSFYTGVENIFKRISIEIDENLPQSDIWHRQLLDQMTEASERRPAVITKSVRITLRGYLDFRHVFRHAYTFELNWRKMAVFVHKCDEALSDLEQELQIFLESFESQKF